MQKTLLDVACESLELKLFPVNICSDTEIVRTRKYTVEVRVSLRSEQGVHDLSEVLYLPLNYNPLLKTSKVVQN